MIAASGSEASWWAVAVAVAAVVVAIVSAISSAISAGAARKVARIAAEEHERAITERLGEPLGQLKSLLAKYGIVGPSNEASEAARYLQDEIRLILKREGLPGVCPRPRPSRWRPRTSSTVTTGHRRRSKRGYKSFGRGAGPSSAARRHVGEALRGKPCALIGRRRRAEHGARTSQRSWLAPRCASITSTNTSLTSVQAGPAARRSSATDHGGPAAQPVGDARPSAVANPRDTGVRRRCRTTRSRPGYRWLR